MNLARVIFELVGIMAFCISFYFLGHIRGFREAQAMTTDILEHISQAMNEMEDEEAEHDPEG